VQDDYGLTLKVSVVRDGRDDAVDESITMGELEEMGRVEKFTARIRETDPSYVMGGTAFVEQERVEKRAAAVATATTGDSAVTTSEVVEYQMDRQVDSFANEREMGELRKSTESLSKVVAENR